VREYFGVRGNDADSVRVIIVAAGRGERMGSLTAERPKCMVPFCGRPLIEWQLAALRAAGLKDITIVGGYLASKIETRGVRLVTNPEWDNTNMVFSLMCARDIFLSGAPIVVAYADLVYRPQLLSALINNDSLISTVVDLRWLDLWRIRFSDPLDDAETLRLSDQGKIVEIGGKPDRLEEIEGQYVGLTYFSPEGASQFAETHLSIGQWEEAKSSRDCYFTDVLRALVSRDVPISAVVTDNGWLEFDSADDVAAYQGLLARNELDRFWSPEGVSAT
jgi:choline kinase